MAENMALIPDPAKQKELEAYAKERAEKAAQAKTEAFRVQSLTLAVQWATNETWSGNSAGIVAAAQVFEHYLIMGTPMDSMAYGAVYQAVRDSSDALRG